MPKKNKPKRGGPGRKPKGVQYGGHCEATGQPHRFSKVTPESKVLTCDDCGRSPDGLPEVH